MSSKTHNEIPMAVCSVVGRILGKTYYSHKRLDALFSQAGAPGDPPQENCADKCTYWLKRANQDPDIDAFAVLGNILVEFMDAWPSSDDPTYLDSRSEIEQKLAEYSLRYYQGRIIGASSSPATKDLNAIIRFKDIPSLKIEFDRALDSIESDPAASITAACSIFEAFCNVYIEDENLQKPTKLGAKTLWQVVQRHLKVHPAEKMDENLKRILGGLASVVNGMTFLRNESSSAHGRGRSSYRVEPRHARLAVNSAHALVFFLLEVWEHRKTHRVAKDPS